MRLTLEFLRDFIHLHSKTNTEKGKVMSQLKAAKASKKEIGAAVDQLKKANESLAKVDQLKPEILKKDDGKDYFATPPTIVPRWIVYVVL
ncbi:Asparagine--tRNA ligase, cytoplasmic 1 [Glycine soja]|uniref:Asparagine--tRNA ligase, cytoplasmic 1 n=1 Tax=Glycine soja TaxID=3848 RepID=A0A0B2PNL6_GLYSO|nr:Asparagine--tRNA ligase, cytoplasmic 1 [Glycine soja]